MHRSGRFSAVALLLVATLCLAPSTSRAQACDPGLTRDEATTWLLAQPHAADVVIMRYPDPVCPGDVLGPSHSGDPNVPIGQPSWFFYRDDDPGTDYEHGVSYLLVYRDGTGTIVMETYGQEWWPVLNGVQLYSDASVNHSSPDRVFGDYPSASCAPPPAPSATPSPREGIGEPPRAAPAPVPGAVTPKLWAILLKGNHEAKVIVNNFAMMTAALKNNTRGPGVPGANIKEAELKDKSSIADKVKEANDNNATQVYVYITGHGGYDRGNDTWFVAGTTADVTVEDLGAEIQKLKACSAFVFLQSCKSTELAIEARTKLSSRAAADLLFHDPNTVAGFAAAEANKGAKYVTSEVEKDNYSNWTADLARAFTDASLRPDPDTNRDGNVSAVEAFDWVAANGCADTRGADPNKSVGTSKCEAPVPASPGTWGSVKARYR